MKKFEKFTAHAAAADQNWPARRRRHNDVGAGLYFVLRMKCQEMFDFSSISDSNLRFTGVGFYLFFFHLGRKTRRTKIFIWVNVCLVELE